MHLSRAVKIAFVAAAALALLAVAFASAECYTFYDGLCPGADDCKCTLKETCGTGGDVMKARASDGTCAGSCHFVTADECPGDSSCLKAGTLCSHSNGNHSGNAAIKCAQEWVDEQIPYCQCNGAAECCGTCPYCDQYRCDCSGYVSYCLGLSYGYTTRSLPEVAHQIAQDDLRKGDMMLCVSDHVVFFAGWTDESKTHYVCYQEPGCHTEGPHHAFMSVVPYPFNWNPTCFVPYRVNGGSQFEETQRKLRQHVAKSKRVVRPLHKVNLDEDAIAPRWLVEQAAQSQPSYPPQYKEEALIAAEGVRAHLQKLNIKPGF
jgi:hypothetical protein